MTEESALQIIVKWSNGVERKFSVEAYMLLPVAVLENTTARITSRRRSKPSAVRARTVAVQEMP